ncbi:gephyrin-like molybdotransferase Glp [Nocardioides sp. Arc9.136]|uniref:molybdotransferase-like divisome protein Glp n=1 Tax=Nocardioides sp. Arc9.136 TaxID=2996826 RepID=UPI00266674A4|nr:gephyrin-like molybdotransferase Glp [Nocardioides sp. Arc9.136]WKN49228.1 molybdopterin molybdotransferase MoeA [Nocardioides sp. Arc9.136]
MADPAPRSVDEHLERVLADIEPLAAHPQPLMDALGLAAAEDVVSTLRLPGFDNSGMDGYAVRHADVVTAGAEHPVHLPVVGEIGAGQSTGLLALPPGTAAKIMTGAPVPSGADCVVPYEWTDRGVAQVRVDRAPALGQHVRRAGEDVAEGDLLVEAGTVLGPRHLGLLAAVGRPTVVSRPRPRVVVLSTGSELREPGQPLGTDSIYDGNSFLLAASARRAGAIAYRVGIVPDEPRAFLDALEDQLVRADVVVTSGGVSQGDFDIVKEALRPRGVWFGPVAMQPGKPQGFGHVGEDRVPIFTLPGNPVSSYISFETFVLPALRKMMGLAPCSRPQVTARLTHAVTSQAGKRQFLRGALDHSGAGLQVAPVGGPGSHLIGDLAASDCLVVVPEDVTSLAPGDTVSVVRLDQEF